MLCCIGMPLCFKIIGLCCYWSQSACMEVYSSACRMSWIFVERSHPCHLEHHCNTSSHNQLCMSLVQAFQSLQDLLAKQLLDRDSGLSIVIISQRIQCFQMLCQALFVEVFSIIKLVRGGTTLVVYPWGMETGTLNPAFLTSKAGILLHSVPMILQWTCMQTNPAYWFIYRKFLFDHPSAIPAKEVNNH